MAFEVLHGFCCWGVGLASRTKKKQLSHSLPCHGISVNAASVNLHRFHAKAPPLGPRATLAGGELYTFGSNVYGQLGLGGAWEWHRPIRVEYNWSQDVVEEVVCGGYHTFARSGAIVTFPKVWSAPGVTLLLGMIFFKPQFFPR